jgi:membrane protein
LYFVRFVLFCTDTINEFLGKNCPYVAGAISFYTLFSLFPLTLAIISVLGYVLGPNAEETKLARDIASVLPVSTEYIGDTLQGVARARAITGIASIFGLLWASTAAFGAIRRESTRRGESGEHAPS